MNKYEYPDQYPQNEVPVLFQTPVPPKTMR